MGTKKNEILTVQERRRQGETVFDMLINRWQVRAECEACRLVIVVSLMNLFRLQGPTHRLWDRTIPCPRFQGAARCAGRMVYKAKPPEAPMFGYLGPFRVRRDLGSQASGTVRTQWVDPTEIDNGPWRDKLGPTPPDPR